MINIKNNLKLTFILFIFANDQCRVLTLNTYYKNEMPFRIVAENSIYFTPFHGSMMRTIKPLPVV